MILLYFIEMLIEMIVGYNVVVRNNREKSCVPFTQFSQLVTSYKTVEGYHN